MDAAKVLPWLLATIFAGICWKQQQTINAYEKETVTKIQNETQVSSDGQIDNDSNEIRAIKTSDSPPVVKRQIKQDQPVMVQPNAEQSLTKEELEDLIEHRVLERLEQMEDEKLQKRVDSGSLC